MRARGDSFNFHQQHCRVEYDTPVGQQHYVTMTTATYRVKLLATTRHVNLHSKWEVYGWFTTYSKILKLLKITDPDYPVSCKYLTWASFIPNVHSPIPKIHILYQKVYSGANFEFFSGTDLSWSDQTGNQTRLILQPQAFFSHSLPKIR